MFYLEEKLLWAEFLDGAGRIVLASSVEVSPSDEEGAAEL